MAKLWTGVGPNVARNALINAAELASYDQVKQVRMPATKAGPDWLARRRAPMKQRPTTGF